MKEPDNKNVGQTQEHHPKHKAWLRQVNFIFHDNEIIT